MDLTTRYMGLTLKNPVVPSASPLSASLDMAKRLEDAGASAIVMYSLFEEQIMRHTQELDYYLTTYNESYAEANSYFPEPDKFFNYDADGYLEHLRLLKQSLDIPVIASLNGVSVGGWMNHAKKIEEAGADGLELNIYYVPTDPTISGLEVERIYLDDLSHVKSTIDIPVAVKLNPYFSAIANMAMKLDQGGANALVLFNRFYQPDIDLEERSIVPNLKLSQSYDIRLPLRWIAILYGTVNASLAASSGIHNAEDALKLIMAGADVTMLTSVIYKKGPEVIKTILEEMQQWMDEHETGSLKEMKGSMSYLSAAEPAALVRANYIKTLQSMK